MRFMPVFWWAGLKHPACHLRKTDKNASVEKFRMGGEGNEETSPQ
jgi:hypothetical protein